MADRYLNVTTGDDAYDGESATDDGGGVGPWASWDHALTAAQAAGDVDNCYVADGTYRENTGGTFNYLRTAATFGSETTFRAATPGSTGVIVTTSGSGTPTYNADFRGTSNLTLIDITFRLTQATPSQNVHILGTSANFKMVRCKVLRGDQTHACGGIHKESSVGNGGGYTFENCDFEGYGSGKTALYVVGATGNLVDDVVIRNCRCSGAPYGLRATYVSNLKIYGGRFVGTTGGQGIRCGNADPAVDEGMAGLEIHSAEAANLLTATDAAFLGGGCNNPIIEGCHFKGGRYSLVDASDGATFRSCVCDAGATIPLNLLGTNSRAGNASTYDNCTFVTTGNTYGVYAPTQGAGQARDVTFTNCVVSAFECFGPDVSDHWGAIGHEVLFTNGVYGPGEGDSPPSITSSTNAVPEIDAMSIPTKGGNCDVGKGVVGKRTLGQLDLYGRPVLRADADSIGAVYPQRADPRNILRPIVQYASEAAA